MTPNVKEAPCAFCGKRPVRWGVETITFRQASDKGYVHCRVEIETGICDRCGARTLPTDADRIFDEEFERQYRRL